MTPETRTTDVVIIGAECTGITSAVVLARNPELRVTLLTKGESIGRTGATMLAHEPLSSCVLDSKSAHEVIGLKQGDARDSPEAFLDDVVTYGDSVNDQKLASIVVRRAPSIAKEIGDWGFSWNYDVVDRSPGHRFPRDYYGKKAWGPQFLKLGLSLLKERGNVEVVPETMALDLLVSGNRVTGLTAVDLQTGQFLLIKCNAVIIACGGCQNLFSHVTTGRELTGDGYAMAFRAGAELMDMEFIKFYTSIVWPEGAAHDPSALLQAFRHTAHWLNKYGDRFLTTKWGHSSSEGDGDGWNSVSKIAIATEILQDRGGKHGIYYSIKHLPKNLVDFQGQWGHLKDWKDETTRYDYNPYIEMMKDGYALEIGLACHYNEGGIVIDEKCNSGIRGLYAAGEASAGVDGGQRIAGMALTTSFVQGYVAAENCTNYLDKTNFEEPDPKLVDRSNLSAYSISKNKQTDSSFISPTEMRKRIQSIADRSIWVVRDEASLEAASTAVPTLRKQLEKMVLQNNDLSYNMEFIESLQVRNLVDCLEIIATSALARTESRGGHYRSDFPLTDNNHWLRNVIVFQGPNGTIETVTRPVVKGEILLPSGVFSYGENFAKIDSFEK